MRIADISYWLFFRLIASQKTDIKYWIDNVNMEPKAVVREIYCNDYFCPKRNKKNQNIQDQFSVHKAQL